MRATTDRTNVRARRWSAPGFQDLPVAGSTQTQLAWAVLISRTAAAKASRPTPRRGAKERAGQKGGRVSGKWGCDDVVSMSWPR